MTKQLKRTCQRVLLCCGITLFSNCQQSEIEKSGSNDLSMSIVANIGNFSDVPDSRYVGEEPNSVVFGEADCMGVFVNGGEASKWTYGNSGWASETPVYWPDIMNTHLFQAFYPYALAASVDNVPMPDLRGQDGTMSGLSECDFLVATTTQDYGTNGVVSFQGEDNSFKHVSSLLKLTIKGDDDLKTSTLTCIKIEGSKIVAPASYSFTDNTVTLSPDSYSDVLEFLPLYEMENKDATFYFIVNEKTDASSTVTLTIEYTTDGKEYVAQMENFAGNVFGGGLQQSYTLTIKDRVLMITGAEILPWGEGETLDNIVINGMEKNEG